MSVNSKNFRLKVSIPSIAASFICHMTFGMPPVVSPLPEQEAQGKIQPQEPHLNKVNVIITMTTADQESSFDKYFNGVKIAADGAEFLIQGSPISGKYKERYARILAQAGGREWKLTDTEDKKNSSRSGSYIP